MTDLRELESTLPRIPSPPAQPTLGMWIDNLRYRDDTTLSIYRYGRKLLAALSGCWLLSVVAVGDIKLAIDITLGDAQPSSVPGGRYAGALVLGLLGWVVVPSVIGAAVSSVWSVLAVRRVTEAELDAVYGRFASGG